MWDCPWGIGRPKVAGENLGSARMRARTVNACIPAFFPSTAETPSAEGAVLSVPTYTIHRDKAVWGEDADAFRPERWFEQDKVEVQKTFNPFSFGPRSVPSLLF